MKLVRVLKYAIAIILLCSLQVCFCDKIAIKGIVPSIVIPFVVSVSIVEGIFTGGVVGIVCGLFLDGLSSGTTILYSITYMFLGVVCGYISSTYLRKNVGTSMLFALIGTIICEECIHFLHYTIWGTSGIFDGVLYPILPTAIYSTAFTIPVFYLIRKLFGNTNRRNYI